MTAVQVAARIVEQSIHRLAEEGMDLRGLRYAYGLGVVPPLVDDDLVSMGRINDSLLYGGIANVTVEADDAPVRRDRRPGGVGGQLRLRPAVHRDLRGRPAGTSTRSPSSFTPRPRSTSPTWPADEPSAPAAINYEVLAASFFD